MNLPRTSVMNDPLLGLSMELGEVPGLSRSRGQRTMMDTSRQSQRSLPPAVHPDVRRLEGMNAVLQDEVEMLRSKVQSFERDVLTKLQALERFVASFDGRHQQQHDAHSASLAAAQASAHQLQGRVGDLEAAQGQASARFDALENQAGHLSHSLQLLEQRADSQSTASDSRSANELARGVNRRASTVGALAPLRGADNTVPAGFPGTAVEALGMEEAPLDALLEAFGIRGGLGEGASLEEKRLLLLEFIGFR